jgi:pimeloyl-ACP methyl ester carboxylesterase
MTTKQHSSIAGQLVTLPLPGKKKRHLDGFWTHGKGPRAKRKLLIFVHGMGSNFYKSKFKKAWMRLGPARGVDVFCFNNRGCEELVADEKFSDCLADIDAALAFARSEGYQEIYLLGHSTGCQKITYYQHKRKPRDVAALILTAIGDDLAIARRDLGKDYPRWLKRARELVAEGQGDTRLPPKCLGFTARRFLSAVDPRSIEANLFRLDGELRIFRRLTLPVLAVFPEEEQYACIPVREAGQKLAAATRSTRFGEIHIPRADHSFHGEEEVCVKACLKWMESKT